jgi:hypothetical protein
MLGTGDEKRIISDRSYQEERNLSRDLAPRLRRLPSSATLVKCHCDCSSYLINHCSLGPSIGSIKQSTRHIQGKIERFVYIPLYYPQISYSQYAIQSKSPGWAPGGCPTRRHNFHSQRFTQIHTRSNEHATVRVEGRLPTTTHQA